MGTPLDPLGWVLIAATVASTGAQVYSSMATGAAQQGAYDAEARAHELEAKQADLQAHQVSAQRLRELDANLGAISAARAGNNTSGDSPTSQSIIRSFTRESLGARANEILDARLRRLSAQNAAAASTQAGKAAKTAGTIGAVGDVFAGVKSLAGSWPHG